MDNLKTDKTNSLDKSMIKNVEVKEDGRLLIYYNFNSAREKPASENDKTGQKK